MNGWPACRDCAEKRVKYWRYGSKECRSEGIETLCERDAALALLAGDKFGAESTDWEPVNFWRWSPDYHLLHSLPKRAEWEKRYAKDDARR